MAFRIWPLLCKLIQRQTYSLLSTNYGLWCLFAGLIIIVVTVFHFGEVALQWSMVRYAQNFPIVKHYDNIAGRTFEDRLCLPEPIDIVYTWVNGSDPLLVTQLHAAKKMLQKELNATSQQDTSAKLREKLINNKKFKWKNDSICPLPNCVSALTVAMSGFVRSTSLSQLKSVHSVFSSALKIEFWLDDVDIAFVSFSSTNKMQIVLKSLITYNKHKINMSEVFYTSTIKNGYKRKKNSLMMYDLLKEDTALGLTRLFESKHSRCVSSIDVYTKEKLAVIHFSEDKFAVSYLASAKNNLTLNNRRVHLFPVTYVWSPVTISYDTTDEDMSSNRFADNKELLYSLRSIEKYAPWVRKIFILTNGQIPSWLNLEHPRINLVTHDEVFVNKSHLPTFSSPAIESHIHRIPGLSKKFIYMNDDVFFGSNVWPDDFYTHSNGHKVYLTWAVPNCNEGCPSSWLNDKYCDKACNVSACDWDGGDCLGGNTAKSNWNLGQMVQSGLYKHNLGEYCSSGCAHNWIGDRYCDANCNVPLCGFDAGDCGISNFDKLYSIHFNESILSKKNVVVNIPNGILAVYINLTEIYVSIIDGNYDDEVVVRSAVVSKMFKILSLTFYTNCSFTNLHVQVLGYRGENETNKAVLAFNLTINTLPKHEYLQFQHVQNSLKSTIVSTTELVVPNQLYNESDYFVKPEPFANSDVILSYPANLNNLTLPDDLKKRLELLEDEHKDGELTERGYNASKSLIYQDYIRLKKQHPGRKLLSIDRSNNNGIQDIQVPAFFTFLPWEKRKSMFLDDIYNLLKRQRVKTKYTVDSRNAGRHLLDAYSSSLLHVSRIFNKEFGYLARKVPAHMPHMVDRDIIYEMQDKFHDEFDVTSSHKIRHPHDMQFAFSFNYYVIGVKDVRNLTTLFDQVDTDKSGVLSDRELRSLAALLYKLPLSLTSIKELEEKFINCSTRILLSETNAPKEPYFNKLLPRVTKDLFLKCHEVWRSINVTHMPKYKHEVVGQDDVTFKMIRNNVTYVLYQLDWVRKNPKKFVCLNDDLDHAREDTATIRSILHDFYESLFPVPSQFELRKRYRNRFLYKRDLDAWIAEQKLKTSQRNLVIMFCIILLTLILFRRKCWYFIKRWRNFFVAGDVREHIRDI